MPPDRRVPPRARAPEELDGYLAGLRHALDLGRRGGEEDPEAESMWRAAERALASGRREEAATLLRSLDDHLRAQREESELTEFPRGLVSYVPTGGRGAPVPAEEEPLEQRRRLVLRLSEVVDLDPADRRRVHTELATAGAALARGDKRSAKRSIDLAHSIVEDAAPG